MKNGLVLPLLMASAAAALVVAVLTLRSGDTPESKTAQGPAADARAAGGAAPATPEGEGRVPSVAAPKPPPPDAVAVVAGPFWRGHPDEPRPFGNPDTHPMRELTVSAFRLARHETTAGEYEACVAAGACPARACPEATPALRPEQPATCVTWDAAAAYCAWIGGRLPTEAEWEKAARGADGRRYPWGHAEPSCEQALTVACGATEPADVGARPAGASPCGARDLAGNAAEWTADWYDPLYYAVAPDADAAGPANGERRVVRGGSFATGSRLSMTGYRSAFEPVQALPDLGFRCVWPGP
ncbi:MAG: SUMF1/EgtB/PvdO family nonheme iron enzyme [Deltaproteobacteria bacterium]|nr:SUMF1/EgtB/PvdO family nonheme iron enzyme [Deltaproteobacteria bacterium]